MPSSARLPETGRAAIARALRVLDTLALARQMHPGQRNGLDALCKRYSVDNSHRDLHGALLDADLLLEVYLAMTGGQGALTLGRGRGDGGRRAATVDAGQAPARARCVVRAARRGRAAARTSSVLAALDKASGGKTLWRTFEPDAGRRPRMTPHAGAGVRPQLPRPRAGLVQAHDRRVPGR